MHIGLLLNGKITAVVYILPCRLLASREGQLGLSCWDVLIGIAKLQSASLSRSAWGPAS